VERWRSKTQKLTTSRRSRSNYWNAISYASNFCRRYKVLVAEDVYYPGESETSEFYVSVLLNRATGRNMIMYSTEGGMDIEEVAEHTPHLIFTEEIDPSVGLQGFQARTIAFNLGLQGMLLKKW
jgi:succinyl-CoA synthetase beta subunit